MISIKLNNCSKSDIFPEITDGLLAQHKIASKRLEHLNLEYPDFRVSCRNEKGCNATHFWSWKKGKKINEKNKKQIVQAGVLIYLLQLNFLNGV